MIKRTLEASIDHYLSLYPVLAVTGPRQSGKTTLLKHNFPEYTYLSMEDPDLKAFAQNDTRGFLNMYNSKVILDEVQAVPEIFSFLLSHVDAQNVMGQYILSGSQNFLLMESITQSLAGRVGIFRLFPFDLEELRKSELLDKDPTKVAKKGFYPALFERNINSAKYYADYLDTYVNRDVSQLRNIQDQSRFKDFVKLCAARASQLLNMNELAKDAGISHTTARDWISILETSYITYSMKPYHKNFNKRIVKTPKLYFYDTGLLCYLLNIKSETGLKATSIWGSIFENMIVSDMVKQNAHKLQNRDYYFWRDSNQLEIDLLYSENIEMYLYEIKASSTILNKMTEGLDKFSAFADEPIREKTLIYGGDQNQNRTNFKVRSWKSISD